MTVPSKAAITPRLAHGISAREVNQSRQGMGHFDRGVLRGSRSGRRRHRHFIVKLSFVISLPFTKRFVVPVYPWSLESWLPRAAMITLRIEPQTTQIAQACKPVRLYAFEIYDCSSSIPPIEWNNFRRFPFRYYLVDLVVLGSRIF